LDDSEEEIALGLDDGFGVFEVEQPANGSNRVVIGGQSFRLKTVANKSPGKKCGADMLKGKLKVKVLVSMARGSTSVLDPEDEYVSDELGSSDPDASDDEKGPKYVKYRKEQLGKSYEFKLGMEFNSLDDFKDAIREWNVLNRHHIKFLKNVNIRVRAVCREECGYLAFCSKVGVSHTYQIKTYNKDHTCARVTKNKSASSKWVAKDVIKKLQSDKKINIPTIMKDMRREHAVGITKGRAWKAKQIAKAVVEGDASRQYSMLWRYAAELKRVCPGNNCKINMERPAPTLQPRFSRFYFCFDGCKKGFTSACRPFIGVDGCHLKTRYGGQLLVAVGRDPNDQYFPLAFGVVETETKDSWSWFLQLLLQDVGQDKRYVFISDQQKVLISIDLIIDLCFNRVDL
jgi:hypothetical protein